MAIAFLNKICWEILWCIIIYVLGVVYIADPMVTSCWARFDQLINLDP
jgi:hypothetical protein